MCIIFCILASKSKIFLIKGITMAKSSSYRRRRKPSSVKKRHKKSFRKKSSNAVGYRKRTSRQHGGQYYPSPPELPYPGGYTRRNILRPVLPPISSSRSFGSSYDTSFGSQSPDTSFASSSSFSPPSYIPPPPSYAPPPIPTRVQTWRDERRPTMLVNQSRALRDVDGGFEYPKPSAWQKFKSLFTGKKSDTPLTYYY